MLTTPQPTGLSNTQQSVRLVGIQSGEIDKFWPKAAPLIRLGMGEGEILEHIYFKLLMRQNQLWAAFRGDEMIAACVTELVTIGGRDVCNVRSIGGHSMKDWLHHIETIEAWARANGRSAMRFPEVRKGWQRILKDYAVTKITVEKEL